MEEKIEWRLTKKIVQDEESVEINPNDRCFVIDKLPISKEHEEQIPRFQEELEEMDIEIFKIEGHQFITSDGVYRIVKKISENQYE